MVINTLQSGGIESARKLECHCNSLMKTVIAVKHEAKLANCYSKDRSNNLQCLEAELGYCWLQRLAAG